MLAVILLSLTPAFSVWACIREDTLDAGCYDNEKSPPWYCNECIQGCSNGCSRETGSCKRARAVIAFCETQDCGSYTCSGSSCTTTCSQSCGAACDAVGDCTYTSACGQNLGAGYTSENLYTRTAIACTSSCTCDYTEWEDQGCDRPTCGGYCFDYDAAPSGPFSYDFTDNFCYEDWEGFDVDYSLFTDYADNDIDCCEMEEYYGGTWVSSIDACCGDDDGEAWYGLETICCNSQTYTDEDDSQCACETAGGTWAGEGGENNCCDLGIIDGSPDLFSIGPPTAPTGICKDGVWHEGIECIAASDCEDKYSHSPTCVGKNIEYYECTDVETTGTILGAPYSICYQGAPNLAYCETIEIPPYGSITLCWCGTLQTVTLPAGSCNLLSECSTSCTECCSNSDCPEDWLLNFWKAPYCFIGSQNECAGWEWTACKTDSDCMGREGITSFDAKPEAGVPTPGGCVNVYYTDTKVVDKVCKGLKGSTYGCQQRTQSCWVWDCDLAVLINGCEWVRSTCYDYKKCHNWVYCTDVWSWTCHSRTTVKHTWISGSKDRSNDYSLLQWSDYP